MTWLFAPSASLINGCAGAGNRMPGAYLIMIPLRWIFFSFLTHDKKSDGHGNFKFGKHALITING